MRRIRTFCGNSRRTTRALAAAVEEIRAVVRRVDGHVEGSRNGGLEALYIAGAVALVALVVVEVVVVEVVEVAAPAAAVAPVAPAVELESS